MSHAVVDELLEKTRCGELRSPVSSTFGMNLVAFSRGEATYEMAARPELGNPLGFIQGGVVTALADAAMAAATMSVLEDEEIEKNAITTIDIFARFIRPVNADGRRAPCGGARGAGGWSAGVGRGRRAPRRRDGGQFAATGQGDRAGDRRQGRAKRRSARPSARLPSTPASLPPGTHGPR